MNDLIFHANESKPIYGYTPSLILADGRADSQLGIDTERKHKHHNVWRGKTVTQNCRSVPFSLSHRDTLPHVLLHLSVQPEL